MTEIRPRRLSFNLVLSATVLLALALAVLSYRSLDAFGSAIRPELEKKALVVAAALGAEIGRAVEQGVPLRRIRGLDEYVRSMVAAESEVWRVSITDDAGERYFEAKLHKDVGSLDGRKEIVLPIRAGEKTVGGVHVLLDPRFIEKGMAGILYDVLTAFVVAFLATFELVMVISVRGLAQPMERLQEILRSGADGSFGRCAQHVRNDEVGRVTGMFNDTVLSLHERWQRLGTAAASVEALPDDIDDTLRNLKARLRVPEPVQQTSAFDIRLVMFLFFLSSEMSRSFLPLFAKSLYTPIPGLSESFAVALPFTAYTLVTFIFMPFSARIGEVWGSRRLMLWGMAPLIVSLIVQGVSQSLLVLVVGRCMEGVSFALVSIGAMDYIARVTTKENRATGAVVYSGALFSGALCSTALGGVLADRLGYGGTYWVATALAVIATALLATTVPSVDPNAASSAPVRLRDYGRSLRSLRFLAVALFLTAPMQAIANGFIAYIAPLMLDSAGYSMSVIGRVVAVYFIINIVVGQVAARLADLSGRHVALAVGGLILAGIGAAIPLPDSAAIAALRVGVLGLAVALALPARNALTIDEAARVQPDNPALALAAARLFDRGGTLIGFLLAAAMSDMFGYSNASMVLGIFAIASGVAGYVILKIRP